VQDGKYFYIKGESYALNRREQQQMSCLSFNRRGRMSGAERINSWSKNEILDETKR
jgi:hypothetical protein